MLRYPIREDIAISWASHLDIADASAQQKLGLTPRTTEEWLTDMAF